MTDEEKAEEYIDKKCLKDTGIRKPVKEALLYGLAEGRKETEKENAELKKQIKIDEEIIIGEQQEINGLQKKIEKMKCCGRCKHYEQTNNYLVGTCKGKYAVEGNNICDEWELVK